MKVDSNGQPISGEPTSVGRGQGLQAGQGAAMSSGSRLKMQMCDFTEYT
jgi:hypothetical protein